MGILDSIIGSASPAPITQYGNKADNLLKMGTKQGISALDAAATGYIPQYQAAAGSFDPFLQSGTQLNSLYTDALGGNGQTGYDNAVGAFHNGPGFNFALDQANQNVLRNQAATGGLNSGNTLAALSDRAQGLQNQEFQTWLDNLYRGGSQGLQAGTQKSFALQNFGQQIGQTGAQKADVYTGGAGTRASNASQMGSNLYQSDAQNQANNLQLIGAILGAGSKAAGAYFGA